MPTRKLKNDSPAPEHDPVYQNNPRVYVAISCLHGHGLFARKRLAKGDYIGSYAGRETDQDGTHVLWLYDEDEDHWEGIDGDNEMRFLNHAERPNADFWNTDLYALRTIEPDEEITFDYKWESDAEAGA
jgi:SET domain-containing protein